MDGRNAVCSGALVFIILCQWVNADFGNAAEESVTEPAGNLFRQFLLSGTDDKRMEPQLFDTKVLRQLKKSTKGTQNPCKCSGQTCTCCGTFSVNGKSGDEGCATFRIPDAKNRNQLVRYNFNFNDQMSQQTAPAGNDPKGMCQPFPRFPNSQVCSRFHSTRVENGKVRFCLTMEAKYQGFTFYQMDFDCVTYDVDNQKQVGN